MAVLALKTLTVRDTAERAVKELVTAQHHGQSSFLNLPLIYPSGGFVTVRLDQVSGGFRVSDNGFAYRETESFNAQRSFARTAISVAEADDLKVNKRAIYVDVTADELVRAICDVAKASWIVADRIVGNVVEQAEAELEEYLTERLIRVFGDRVRAQQKIVGASSSEWEVSAIVELDKHRAVFQAVANHANSVFRVSTEFRDLAALDNPPTLVAVVQKMAHFGPKLTLLSREGRVIEQEQPDSAFRSAAA